MHKKFNLLMIAALLFIMTFSGCKNIQVDSSNKKDDFIKNTAEVLDVDKDSIEDLFGTNINCNVLSVNYFSTALNDYLEEYSVTGIIRELDENGEGYTAFLSDDLNDDSNLFRVELNNGDYKVGDRIYVTGTYYQLVSSSTNEIYGYCVDAETTSFEGSVNDNTLNTEEAGANFHTVSDALKLGDEIFKNTTFTISGTIIKTIDGYSIYCDNRQYKALLLFADEVELEDGQDVTIIGNYRSWGGSPILWNVKLCD